MRTKCKPCLYYSSEEKCKYDILSLIDNKIDYDENGYPEIYDYKCLYAFPKSLKLNSEQGNVTEKDLEEFRHTKLPKIKASIIIDGFSKSYDSIKSQIQSLLKIIDLHKNNLVITDICILLSSEQEDKLKFTNYLQETLKIKWKCCGMRVCLNNSYKFLFSLRNINPETSMVFFVSAENDIENTRSVIEETITYSLIKQQPYIFLHNNSLDLENQFDCLSCNLINFNTLKRHNISETDSQADEDLIKEWISRDSQSQLVINVNK